MSIAMDSGWDEIEPARLLPELIVVPTRTQLFMFSAVTWNRHHVHYDKDAAVSEGLPDVVVHRALLGNFLARMLDGWLGRNGEIRELAWKVLQSALPERPLHVGGSVLGKDDEGDRRFIRCDVQIVNQDGQQIVSGNARVEWLGARLA